MTQNILKLQKQNFTAPEKNGWIKMTLKKCKIQQKQQTNFTVQPAIIKIILTDLIPNQHIVKNAIVETRKCMI